MFAHSLEQAGDSCTMHARITQKKELSVAVALSAYGKRPTACNLHSFNCILRRSCRRGQWH